MSAIIETNNGVSSMAFAGSRKNIWHRLGQSLPDLMTADEAQVAANMDRKVYTVPVEDDGRHWSVDRPYKVILEGKMGVTEDGQLFEIPEKVVGITGDQGAQGHEALQMKDRFELAEAAIHASNGKAVWSTAGLIRDGRQGFATLEAPPVILDPNGIADITQRYATVSWAFDGTRATELGSSSIRVVCANTLQLHDSAKRSLIKVKMTSGSYSRFEVAALHWAKMQDEDAALLLQGERMLRRPNGRSTVKVLAEKVLGLEVTTDMSDRQQTIRRNQMDEVMALYNAPTNAPAVGDNGYAAYQTIVEYLDWFSPVKKGEGTEDEARLSNMYDGVHNGKKVHAAALVLAD